MITVNHQDWRGRDLSSVEDGVPCLCPPRTEHQAQGLQETLESCVFHGITRQGDQGFKQTIATKCFAVSYCKNYLVKRTI